MGPTLFNKGSKALLGLRDGLKDPTITRESADNLETKAFQLFP